MRVLLIGADTPLGLALEEHLGRWGRHELDSVSFTSSRWKSERHAKKAIRRARPDMIVDLRLQGAADGGERLSEQDVERCHWLAKACQRNDGRYLLVSTPRVFAGQQDRAYSDSDIPDNPETLAQLLQRAEELVRATCERHLILRMGPVFSYRGRNPLTDMLSQLIEGGTLTLDNSLRGCPVAAVDAARVTAAVLDQVGAGAESWGVFHYCSADVTSCYEFAEVLLASASQFSEFSPDAVSLREEESGRALSWRLDCARLRNTFAIKQVAWRGFIADAVTLYFQYNAAAKEA